MSINQWLCTAGVAVCAVLYAAAASAQTGGVANVSSTALRDSLVAENARLTEWLNLVESRRTALIKASVSLGFLEGPVKRLLSHVGPYEEQLQQERVDNLVLLARLRRMTEPADVEQFVKRPDATPGEATISYRLRRLFWRS